MRSTHSVLASLLRAGQSGARLGDLVEEGVGFLGQAVEIGLLLNVNVSAVDWGM